MPEVQSMENISILSSAVEQRSCIHLPPPTRSTGPEHSSVSILTGKSVPSEAALRDIGLVRDQ